jgi:hypothetical protein
MSIPWTHEDTRAYLKSNPLPTEFVWKRSDNGQIEHVQPTYRTSEGYGKWLHETPHFQGLFELIHDLILEAGERLPDIDEIAAMLAAIKKRDEDNAREMPFGPPN